jgi:hypothetical protein
LENNKNNLIPSDKILSKPVKKSPNSKYLREYKMTLTNLSIVQWEASIGLMLGDASLQTQNKGRTYRMKLEWGDKNKVYAEHVHALFEEWVLSPPHQKTRVNMNGNTVINWGFQTISHNAFNPLKDLFLIKKHKGVADNLIKNHLTGRGLAYWFMDDGGKLDYNKNSKNKGLVLNTHSFSKEEVEIMSIELRNKFNLNTYTRLNKNKSIIVINNDSYERFVDLTDKYFIPSMRYKLPN